MQEAAENFADSSPFRIRSSSVNIDDEVTSEKCVPQF